jgi:hypothetical protein
LPDAERGAYCDLSWRITKRDTVPVLKRRRYMSTVKQLQSRLLNKKLSMKKVSLNMTAAEKGRNTITLKRLTQDKSSLEMDIQRLERQLATEVTAAREKKDNPIY